MSLSPSTLKNFSFQDPPTYQLPRNPEIQKQYDNHMKNKEACAHFKEKVKKTLCEKALFIQKNDFPYQTDKGISHFLVWTTNVQEAIHEIPNIFSGKLITFWKNLPTNCSIPEIDHIHVFAFD